MAISSASWALLYLFISLLPAWLSEKPTLIEIETTPKNRRESNDVAFIEENKKCETITSPSMIIRNKNELRLNGM